MGVMVLVNEVLWAVMILVIVGVTVRVLVTYGVSLMTTVVVGVIVRVVESGGPREVIVVVVGGKVTVLVTGFGLTEVVTGSTGGRYSLHSLVTFVVVSVMVVGIVCVTVCCCTFVDISVLTLVSVCVVVLYSVRTSHGQVGVVYV